MPPQRVGILCPSFWLKMGIDFAHFGLESSWFSKELRECTNLVVVSISTEKERKKERKKEEICKFEMDFKKSFLLLF